MLHYWQDRSAASLMIHVKVDMGKPENQNPKAKLEEGEFIECFTVPLKELYEECGKLEAQGFAIDGKVGAFAEGIEAASIWTWVLEYRGGPGEN